MGWITMDWVVILKTYTRPKLKYHNKVYSKIYPDYYIRQLKRNIKPL